MPEPPDQFTEDTYELALCAQINFGNLLRQNPALARHPMWQIAMLQFDAVVRRLAESGQN